MLRGILFVSKTPNIFVVASRKTIVKAIKEYKDVREAQAEMEDMGSIQTLSGDVLVFAEEFTQKGA